MKVQWLSVISSVDEFLQFCAAMESKFVFPTPGLQTQVNFQVFREHC